MDFNEKDNAISFFCTEKRSEYLKDYLWPYIKRYLTRSYWEFKEEIDDWTWETIQKINVQLNNECDISSHSSISEKLENWFDHIEAKKNQFFIYVKEIAKNIVLNFIKADKAEKRISQKLLIYPSKEDELDFQEQLYGPAPICDFRKDLEKDNLLESLKEVISPDEITLITDHILYGYTIKEIAESRKKKAKTIDSKWRRLLEKLQNISIVNEFFDKTSASQSI